MSIWNLPSSFPLHGPDSSPCLFLYLGEYILALLALPSRHTLCPLFGPLEGQNIPGALLFSMYENQVRDCFPLLNINLRWGKGGERHMHCETKHECLKQHPGAYQGGHRRHSEYVSARPCADRDSPAAHGHRSCVPRMSWSLEVPMCMCTWLWSCTL